MIFLIYVSLMIKLTQPRRKASKKVNSPLSNGPLQKKKKKKEKKIGSNHCFQFLLHITVIPGEIEDSGYSQFFGVNKVHDGLCENGEFTHLCLKISGFLCFQSEINSTFIAAA